MHVPRRYWFPLVLAGGLLACLTGCGQRLHPVEGRVTYADGSPLAGGMVIFQPVTDDLTIPSANGEIRSDGSYRLGTNRPGDGALLGKYRVAIQPPASPGASEDLAVPLPPLIDPKFRRCEKSGLEFEVKAQKNVFPIQVTRPR